MSRADEIAQGLRHEGGSLTFPLVAEEYGAGYDDFRHDRPPPRMTTPSYDLGRARGAREAEAAADLQATLAEQSRRRHAVMQELLAGRPDVLADYNAQIATIQAHLKTPSPTAE